MSRLRILFILAFVCFSVALSAQKSPFRKADKLYSAKSYAKAIPIYEEVLANNDNLSAKNKLANCYRLTNRTGKARELYAEIVTHKRVNPKTFFYYGESLMQVGQYDEARKWFLKYAELKPDDKKGLKMANACEKVKSIQPVFPNAKITFFPENSEGDDTAPVFFQNGIVFSTDRESGLKALKGKSDWTGRGNVHLYFSEQVEEGIYSKPSNFSSKLNAPKKNTGTACFSSDQKEIFFARNDWEANKKGLYTMQLFSSISNENGKWKDVQKLNFCSNKFNYMHPALSKDGKQLFFISDKPGGSGGMDIYVSQRIGRSWKRPQNLGENVNTDGHEGFPFHFADGRLYFCSKGHDGFGGFDVFYTEQDTAGVWQAPVNLGQPINSSFDDVSFHLSEDASKGLFTSGREGGDDDVFLLELSEISADQLVNRVHMAEAMKQYVGNEQVADSNEQGSMSNEQGSVDSPQSAVSSSQSTVNSSQSSVGRGQTALSRPELMGDSSEPEVKITQPMIETEEPEEKIQNSNLGTFVQTEQEVKIEKTEVAKEKEVMVERVEPSEKIQNEASIATEEVKTSVEAVPTKPTMQQPLAKPEIRQEGVEEMVVKKKKSKTKKKKNKKKRKKKKSGNETPAKNPIEYVASTEKESLRNQVEEVDQVQAIQTGMMIIEEVMVKQASFQMESRSSSAPVPKEFNTSSKPASNQGNQKSMPWPNQPALSNNRSTQSTRDIVSSKSTVFTSQYFEELKTNYSQNVNDEGKVFIVSNMQYSSGNYKVDDNLASRLNQLVTILRNNPTIDLEVRCHTESIGDDQENLMLSELRAHTVRNFLIREGVSESRLSYRGYGESELLNNCENGVDCNLQQHQENQRVEIKVLKY